MAQVNVADVQPLAPGASHRLVDRTEGAAPPDDGELARRVAELDLLIADLGRTSAHFIRCIKPNGQMAAASFDGRLALDQLRALGMIAAVEMMQRLGRSDRARQSFIRHLFRYFMGRNEMLSDSKTLIEAEKAYLDQGGSFKALVVSLLSSDSFLYRR